jgi:hypothetical protein
MDMTTDLERKLLAEIGWDRVRSMTASHVNERIQREIEGEIRHLASQGPEAVQRRIFALERRWNIDQALMTNLAVLGLAGVLAGAFHSRKWLWAPAIQLAFLFMHAAQGWCPPSPVFRRLGFRTQKEIDAERRLLQQHMGLVARDEPREQPRPIQAA